MRIAIAGDHTAVAHKRAIVERLKALGHEVLDFGADEPTSCDYPDHAIPACRAILVGQAEAAVLMCGTGIGMSIVANKFPGLRCGLAHSVETARLAKAHNRAQVLALGARVVDIPTALALVEAWLNASIEHRHQPRIDKIARLERELAKRPGP